MKKTYPELTKLATALNAVPGICAVLDVDDSPEDNTSLAVSTDDDKKWWSVWYVNVPPFDAHPYEVHHSTEADHDGTEYFCETLSDTFCCIMEELRDQQPTAE